MPHEKTVPLAQLAPQKLSTQQTEALNHALARYASEPGGLLPLLHAVQHSLGFIPRAAVPLIADAFKLSRAEVHGIISYYPHLREQPHGQTLIQICRAESCQSNANFTHN